MQMNKALPILQYYTFRLYTIAYYTYYILSLSDYQFL